MIITVVIGSTFNSPNPKLGGLGGKGSESLSIFKVGYSFKTQKFSFGIEDWIEIN